MRPEPPGPGLHADRPSGLPREREERRGALAGDLRLLLEELATARSLLAQLAAAFIERTVAQPEGTAP